MKVLANQYLIPIIESHETVRNENKNQSKKKQLRNDINQKEQN